MWQQAYINENEADVGRVKVDIRNPNMELNPGMPADADIHYVEGLYEVVNHPVLGHCLESEEAGMRKYPTGTVRPETPSTT